VSSEPGSRAGAAFEAAAPGLRRGAADRVIDEVMPEGVEWERLVRAYPVPALALAAAAGFWLGVRHGTALVAAGGAFASRQASRGLREALGEDVDLGD